MGAPAPRLWACVAHARALLVAMEIDEGLLSSGCAPSDSTRTTTVGGSICHDNTTTSDMSSQMTSAQPLVGSLSDYQVRTPCCVLQGCEVACSSRRPVCQGRCPQGRPPHPVRHTRRTPPTLCRANSCTTSSAAASTRRSTPRRTCSRRLKSLSKRCGAQRTSVRPRSSCRGAFPVKGGAAIHFALQRQICCF